MFAPIHKLLTRRSIRRGIATLEFAMALPTLLLLMVGITWLGFSVIGQSEVLIEAREKTWQERFDDKAKTPLVFPSGLKALKNPLYPAESDYVSETATKTIHVSPIFDKAAPPTASNTVLAGSWDHRAMPFTSFPDWKLMAVAGSSGTGGELQSFLNSIGGALGSIAGLGQTFLSTIQSQISNITGLGSGSGSSGGTGALDQAAEDAKAKDAEEKAANKKKFQDRLDQLGGRVGSNNKVEVTRTGGPLDLAIKEVERLEGEAKKAKDDAANDKQTNTNNTDNTNNNNKADDDAQKKQAKDAADANKRDLDLAKGKRARIESDIRDADAELKASG